ncbi:MAG TPA: Fic family protein [Terriglobales bacterium]|nr:Fic family protein [Terriglobales bacterium]
MADYVWHPVEPLSEADKIMDLAGMGSLYASWRQSKGRLEGVSPTRLKEFNERLVRRLSIETGILERIYDIDRGTTEALVAHGFTEDLVSRSGSDVEPARLIDILRDQEAATHLVMDCVANNRGLTKSVMHELHAILTRHQETTTAVDQFGERREIQLLRGRFKQLPNNPRRPDGGMHGYCPPIHVEAEVDKLLGWLVEYRGDDPVVVAAWLHHRFTQIHPYQDGNGRMARALTTLVLLRSQLLPLVIDRDLRSDYLSALEAADRGDLTPLGKLFAGLERKAILQALSVDAEAEIAHQRSLTSAVMESLAEKFGKRHRAQQTELRQVNPVAQALRTRARRLVREALDAFPTPYDETGGLQIYVTDGGPDQGNAHWYRRDVVETAKQAGKFANLVEDHYFLKASLRVGQERLVFVVSFHHVGRELSGIMEATAFAQLESVGDAEESLNPSKSLIVCSLDPFVFTYQTQEKDIADAFDRWLDAALAVAVKEFGDQI